MTKSYLLIIAGEVIDYSTRFYRIKVGSSVADQAKLHVLSMLAYQQNWYLAEYTHTTADFLLRISLSLSVKPDDLDLRTLPVAKFLSAWKKFSKLHSADGVPTSSKQFSRRQAHRQRETSPKGVLQHAESVRRIKPKSLVKDFNAYLAQIS